MAYAEPYRPAYDVSASPDERRSVAKWMLGFLASVALFGALSTLVLFQITAESQATQSLRRATAALTEIDASLARHYDDMQAQAEASPPGGIVVFTDYPVAITLSREDVLGVSQEELRVLILDRSADRLYEDGTGVLRESAEVAGDLGLFSVAGFTDRALGLLTRDTHRFAAIATIVLTAIAIGLTAAAVLAARSWGRLVTAGVVVALAGIALTVGAGIVRAYASSQVDVGEYLRAELFGITQDHAMVAIRTGAAFAVAGLLVAGIGIVMGALDKNESRSNLEA